MNTGFVVPIETKVLKRKFRVPQTLSDLSHCAEQIVVMKKGKIESK